MKFNHLSLIICSLLMASSATAAQRVTLTVEAMHPGAVINKNIYGQFVEHLGTGVYGGMWVGPESPIPNIRGWRKDVIAALQSLQVPLVRWPGGCFADDYDWRDGIGPREERPDKINTNWGGVKENNAVGTHEFFDLLELIGAEAYINGNVGTGTPQETAEWVEYMTADGHSSLARLRAKNGHPKPFKLAFFGIGNESWGCGGNMTPQRYADLYNHHATFVRAPQAAMPRLVASGGLHGDPAWTDYLSKNFRANASAIGLHYYTVPLGGGPKKGAATGFGEAEWISTLKAALKLDEIIGLNIAKLKENDPGQKLTLAVDEWGAWYDPTPGTPPRFLQQQNSLRDALVAALSLHIFHAHADYVSMANIAQMVNVLQAMILTDGDKMVLTPTYHVFKMYVPFQDATSLPVTLADNPQYIMDGVGIPTVSASAARGKDGKLYLGLVNTHPRDGVEISVNAGGVALRSFRGSVLSAAKMDAHNSFMAPEVVVPAPFGASMDKGQLIVKLPAKSVAVVALME